MSTPSWGQVRTRSTYGLRLRRLIALVTSITFTSLTCLQALPAIAHADEVTTYIGKHYEIRPDGTTISYIYMPTGAGEQLIAAVIKSPSGAQSIQYYHPDHLGSTNLITDEAAQVVARTEYAPYGSTSHQSGSANPTHKFTGQRYDDPTGLYYYNSRYYDAQLGRFIQPDPIVPVPGDPQAFNRYSYVRNNPLKYTDPSGHFFFLPFLGALLVKAAIGAVVGAALNATVAAFTGGNVGKAALVGLAGGAIFGAGGAITGLSALQGATTAAIVGRATVMGTAGALAGLSGAGMTGQPLGRGAGIGAVLGFAGSILPAPNIAWLGRGTLGRVFNPVLNNALVGAGLGGGAAAIQGESVARGALGGALLAGTATLVGGALEGLRRNSIESGMLELSGPEEASSMRIKHEHGGRWGRVAHIGTQAEIDQAIRVDLAQNPIELGAVNQIRRVIVNGQVLEYRATFTGEMTSIDVPTYYDPTKPKTYGK